MGNASVFKTSFLWTRWKEKTPYYGPQGGGSQEAMMGRIILCIVCWSCGEQMNLMRNLVVWQYLTRYLSYCWNHKHSKSFEISDLRTSRAQRFLLNCWILSALCMMFLDSWFSFVILRFSCLTGRVTYLIIRFGNSQLPQELNFPRNSSSHNLPWVSAGSGPTLKLSIISACSEKVDSTICYFGSKLKSTL